MGYSSGWDWLMMLVGLVLALSPFALLGCRMRSGNQLALQRRCHAGTGRAPDPSKSRAPEGTRTDMSAILTFVGAAGTVTGSKTLVEHDRRHALVDCGLYQGERQWRRLNWERLPVAASSIQDAVITHTHLDHCGYLPALVRQGFAGPAWCSSGSAALVPIVLRDSAHLLEAEAEYAQTSGYSRHDPRCPCTRPAMPSEPLPY